MTQRLTGELRGGAGEETEMTKVEWIGHPVELYRVLYAMLAAGVCLCLFLFFTLKLEIRAAERRRKAGEAWLAEALVALRSAFDSMRAEMHASPLQKDTTAASAPNLTALNLTRLYEVLQTCWENRSSEQVASEIGSPQPNADLLVKIHKLALDLLR